MGIVIFGAGQRGKSVVDFLGANNIKAILDNYKKGYTVNEITVKSIEEVDISNDDVVIIAIDGVKARQISKDLNYKGIHNYIYWDEVLERFGFAERINNSAEPYGQIRDKKWVKKAVSYIECVANKEKNAESDVEFYVTYSFEIYHYLPIYNEMRKRGINANIVLEHSAINVSFDFLDYAEAKRVLNELDIEYKERANEFAKIAFTTQYVQLLQKYKNKKVLLPYGAAILKEKAFQLKQETVSEFDYVCVHGNFFKKIIEKYISKERIIDIGYPKYAHILERGITKDTIRKELNISSDKPILVYFPTWDEYSSIPVMDKVLNRLKKFFYVVAKPHHCTTGLPVKKGDLDILVKSCDLVLSGNYDFYKASVLADVAIIDAKSGALNEVPFANPEVKTLAIMNGTNVEDYYINIAKYTETAHEIDDVFDKSVGLISNDDEIVRRKKVLSDFYGKMGSDIDGKLVKLVDKLQLILHDCNLSFLHNSGGIEIHYLVIVVGQACNLKCINCANFCPEAPTESLRYDCDEIINDIEKLLLFASRIEHIQIQGGEPLIYNELPKLINWLYKNKNIGRITIATNGKFLPNNETLEMIHRCDVEVRISEYESTGAESQYLYNSCIEHDIKCSLYKFQTGNGKWNYMGGVSEKYNETGSDERFYKCSFRSCLTLENGEIYRCSRAANSYRVQKYNRKENDYLNLRSNDFSAEKLVDYLDNKRFMTACEYCLGTDTGIRVKAGEQKI